jgi:hypothetical protein
LVVEQIRKFHRRLLFCFAQNPFLALTPGKSHHHTDRLSLTYTCFGRNAGKYFLLMRGAIQPAQRS